MPEHFDERIIQASALSARGLHRLSDAELQRGIPPRGPSGCDQNQIRRLIQREAKRRGLDWDLRGNGRW